MRNCSSLPSTFYPATRIRYGNELQKSLEIGAFSSIPEQAEGVGARVRRSIGTSQLRNLDPFLMLDEFNVKKPAGFPDHPHRGFETVTYMLSGTFQHEDFAGHSGIIGPGDLQWMTAGKGIVHAEIPHPDSDIAHGLQLWVNLPKKEKLCEPRYQELLAKDVPLVTPSDGVKVKVIAGKSHGVDAAVFTKTPIIYLDIKLDPSKTFVQDVPAGWTCFGYILDGRAQFGDASETIYDAHHAIVFSSDADKVQIKSIASESLHFVLLAAEPINEPIVQHGPFVMNTQDEIHEAIIDFQNGKNGFERAVSWHSKIAKQYR